MPSIEGAGVRHGFQHECFNPCPLAGIVQTYSESKIMVKGKKKFTGSYNIDIKGLLLGKHKEVWEYPVWT